MPLFFLRQLMPPTVVCKYLQWDYKYLYLHTYYLCIHVHCIYWDLCVPFIEGKGKEAAPPPPVKKSRGKQLMYT